MPKQAAKGLVMAADTRNAKVVIALTVSMTVGAALLLWLEPTTRGWSPTTLLMAERGTRVHEVAIDYVPPTAPLPAEMYDCIVYDDGDWDWKPRGSSIRLAVAGSTSQHLSEAQANTLLAVLGSMKQLRGLDLNRVRLLPESDARRRPELPPEAHDLCELLARKRIIP
ncbi:MAG: hypothetical protein KKB50_16740 [Planctomycetes bacterium]|nr:hypothetical protein [Planctomycetota bacterium]